MCIKFQVEEIVAEKIQTTIVSYRDNVDLQVLIDGVQQEVCLSLFSKWLFTQSKSAESNVFTMDVQNLEK